MIRRRGRGGHDARCRANRPWTDLPNVDTRSLREFDEVVEATELLRLRRTRPFAGLSRQPVDRQQGMSPARQSTARRLWPAESQLGFRQEEGRSMPRGWRGWLSRPAFAELQVSSASSNSRTPSSPCWIDNFRIDARAPCRIAAIRRHQGPHARALRGVKVEILGFTTRAWKAGKAGEWLASASRPSRRTPE